MTLWWGLGLEAGFSLTSRGGCGCQGAGKVGSGAWLGDELDGSFCGS